VQRADALSGRCGDGRHHEKSMIRPLLTSIAVLLAVGGTVIELSHVWAWRIRRQAETAYYNGDFEGALSKYRKVLDLRPGEPRTYTDPADSISQYLSGSGQTLPLEEFEALAAQGVRYYLQAIDSGPPSAWSYARLAVLADALGRARSREQGVDLARLTGDTSALRPEDRLSEAAWAKAVEIEPRNFYYRDFLGDFYFRRGFIEPALAHFRFAVRLHPSLDAHYYLSDYATVSPVVLNAVEAGVQDALAAEDTVVPEYKIHRFLAALYLKLNLLEDAKTSLEAARTVASMPYEEDVAIGRILVRTGDDTAALEAFRRATELEPDYGRAWLMLGVTLSRTGNHDEAVDAAYRARSLRPGHYATSSALARVLAAAGRIDEAAGILEHIVLSHRDKPVPYIQLIELYEKQGRFTDAVRVARQLAARYPGEDLYRQQLRQLETAAGAAR